MSDNGHMFCLYSVMGCASYVVKDRQWLKILLVASCFAARREHIEDGLNKRIIADFNFAILSDRPAEVFFLPKFTWKWSILQGSIPRAV